jgi:predicted transcriptional regulator
MERYQVLLEPEQRKRLERIARRQRRTLASVLRQALDVGLDALERQTDVWERREQILAKWRREQADLPRIEADLIHEARQERDADMERVWRGES